MGKNEDKIKYTLGLLKIAYDNVYRAYNSIIAIDTTNRVRKIYNSNCEEVFEILEEYNNSTIDGPKYVECNRNNSFYFKGNLIIRAELNSVDRGRYLVLRNMETGIYLIYDLDSERRIVINKDKFGKTINNIDTTDILNITSINIVDNTLILIDSVRKFLSFHIECGLATLKGAFVIDNKISKRGNIVRLMIDKITYNDTPCIRVDYIGGYEIEQQYITASNRLSRDMTYKLKHRTIVSLLDSSIVENILANLEYFDDDVTFTLNNKSMYCKLGETDKNKEFNEYYTVRENRNLVGVKRCNNIGKSAKTGIFRSDGEETVPIKYDEVCYIGFNCYMGYNTDFITNNTVGDIYCIDNLLNVINVIKDVKTVQILNISLKLMYITMVDGSTKFICKDSIVVDTIEQVYKLYSAYVNKRYKGVCLMFNSIHNNDYELIDSNFRSIDKSSITELNLHGWERLHNE